jgi:dUTP pyrophosphatase
MVMEREICFAKMRRDAILPSKNIENAGYDVYANFPEEFMLIPAHSTIMIPTGIASVLPESLVFILKERGSTGTKGMAQRCGVIDSGYRGEWFVPITNTTDECMAIVKKDVYGLGIKGIKYPYDKAICQALLVDVPVVSVKQIHKDQLSSYVSERGSGMLGSSGK